MFSEKDLQVLLDYSAESQILSVYLNTDPTKTSTEAAKLKLRNALKTIDLPEDIQAVEDYVNLEYDWSAKGLVVFSSQKEGLFEAHQFNLPVPTRVFVGERPMLRPLIRLIDTFTGWSVALVDMQGARFSSFDFGELDKSRSVSGEEVKQAKRGGGNAMPGRMGGADASGKIENIIDQNIKEVIDIAVDFFTKHRIRRIMIGGTEENIARFREALPKSWQSLVVGQFPMHMNASDSEVLAQATEEALAAQQKQTRALVTQAITQAAKGGQGVIGLIDTLNAIHEGRLKTLLVSQEYEEHGFRCKGCGYLSGQRLDSCPFCGAQFEEIDTAVEMAVRQALRNSAEVKVVVDDEHLAKAGNIAGILRY